VMSPPSRGRFTIGDDLNEPLPAELKIAYCGVVWRSPGEYRMKMPDRDGQRSSNGRMFINGR
jgi:hypothetical protein